MTTPMSAPARFFNLVSKPEGTSCWIWTGQINKAGYGQFHKFRGDNGKFYAHRFSYELAFGPIPDELTVDHMCYMPACVNPVHLQLLTHGDNAKRKRHPTHCPQGHEYTPENKSRTKDGYLKCKVCNRERMRRSTARNRAAA